MARLLFIGREYEDARPLLEEILEREPGSAEMNLLLGELWVEQRQPEKGIPHLEKAAVGGPLQLRARAVLGRAYVDSGQAAKAIPHLEAALVTDEDGSLRFQLARAYQSTGQADRARRMRQEFQEIQRSQERTQEENLVLTPP
jgi:predicted Zn-dependent protease